MYDSWVSLSLSLSQTHSMVIVKDGRRDWGRGEWWSRGLWEGSGKHIYMYVCLHIYVTRSVKINPLVQIVFFLLSIWCLLYFHNPTFWRADLGTPLIICVLATKAKLEAYSPQCLRYVWAIEWYAECKITAGHWPFSNHFSKMAYQNFSVVHSLCTNGQSY